MRLLSTILFLLALGTSAMAIPGPVICIDPGHPSEVGPGTRGKRLTEIHVVWQVAQLLKAKLEQDGYQVVLTKESEPALVTNRERAEIANKTRAALLLRLHCDAEGGSGFGTYYPSKQGRAGKVVGPSAAVLRSSRVLAVKFHDAASRMLTGKLHDRGLMTDLQTAIGSRQGALTGSIFSKVPVLLVEMVVLTNRKDEDFLIRHDGFEMLAKALRAGVHAAVPIDNEG